MTDEREHVVLSDHLAEFIKTTRWTFAKTYAATWPHEYIVQAKVPPHLFDELAVCIYGFGYHERFFSRPVIYLDYDGYSYWQCDNIINRCVLADTFHRRKLDGRMPVSRGY